MTYPSHLEFCRARYGANWCLAARASKRTERYDVIVTPKNYALDMAMDVNHQSDIVNREKLATDLIVKTIPGFPGDQWINQAIIMRDPGVEGMRIEIMSLPQRGGEARSIGELIESIMADIVARQEAE